MEVNKLQKLAFEAGVCPVYFAGFMKNFGGDNVVYLEDSLLWHALNCGVIQYTTLSIHERINFKQSYYDDSIEMYEYEQKVERENKNMFKGMFGNEKKLIIIII